MKQRVSYLFLAVLVVLFAGSSARAQSANTQPLNQVVQAPGEEGEPYLFGPVDRQGFSMMPFAQWFQENYDGYDPDPKVLEKLEPLVKDCTIEVFMGTWCGDSQREIPRLYRILDGVGFEERSLKVCAMAPSSVDPRRCPDGRQQNRNIVRIPTIIVSREGEELGRIIEYPVKTLEEDLLAIVRGDPYQPNYALPSQIHLYVQEHGLEALEANRDSLEGWYQSQGFSHDEVAEAVSQTIARYRTK